MRQDTLECCCILAYLGLYFRYKQYQRQQNAYADIGEVGGWILKEEEKVIPREPFVIHQGVKVTDRNIESPDLDGRPKVRDQPPATFMGLPVPGLFDVFGGQP